MHFQKAGALILQSWGIDFLMGQHCILNISGGKFSFEIFEISKTSKIIIPFSPKCAPVINL